MATKEQVFYSHQDPGSLASAITTATVVPGVAAAGTISLPGASSIVAVLAVTTATGAVATKFLLAVTTDYTFNATTKLLTCVTSQSANTLIVIYK